MKFYLQTVLLVIIISITAEDYSQFKERYHWKEDPYKSKISPIFNKYTPFPKGFRFTGGTGIGLNHYTMSTSVSYRWKSGIELGTEWSSTSNSYKAPVGNQLIVIRSFTNDDSVYLKYYLT